MIKKIIIAFIVLALVGVYTGYKMYNKPHQDVDAAKAVVTLSAGDLLNAFKENEASAGTRFVNKIIAVTGKISTIKKEGNQMILQLETTDPLSTVICNLDSASVKGNHEFKEGDLVNIKGICSGYLTDVILDRCVMTNFK